MMLYLCSSLNPRHSCIRSGISILAAWVAAQLPALALATGLPEQDPYVAWARQTYQSGHVPGTDELQPRKVLKCTLAFSMEDLFYYEVVPGFQFEVDGSRVRNTLKLPGQREFARREYDFRFQKARTGELNLARRIKLAWYVSPGANWANPETATPFDMTDSIRASVGGRLIVQRSVSGKDRERLSETYRAHQRALGQPDRAYEMPDAIPLFGQIPDGDPNKRQYAFQYFVCDRDGGNHPLKEGEQAPPRAGPPPEAQVGRKLTARDLVDEDGNVRTCPEGMVAYSFKLVRIFTETAPEADDLLNEDYFTTTAHLRHDRNDQSVIFTPEGASQLNAMSSKDSTDRTYRVSAGHPYRVKSFGVQYRCRKQARETLRG